MRCRCPSPRRRGRPRVGSRSSSSRAILLAVRLTPRSPHPTDARMMLALLSATVALAALPAEDVLQVEPGAFVLGPGTSKVTVTAVGVPRAIGILPEYRTCRVQLAWHAATATSSFSVV